MKLQTHSSHALAGLCLPLVLLLSTAAARAVMVDIIVTPQIGSFLYEVSVHNDEAEDLAIVTITDAPLGDPLVDPSLTAPAGFFGSYDGGFGFIDLLPVIDVFPAGLTVSGFSFESLSGPGANFTTFEALGIFGNFFSGDINVRVVDAVPDSGSTLLMAGLGFLSLVVARRRQLNMQRKAQS